MGRPATTSTRRRAPDGDRHASDGTRATRPSRSRPQLPPGPGLGEPGPFVVGDEVGLEGPRRTPRHGLVPDERLQWRVRLDDADGIDPYALNNRPAARSRWSPTTPTRLPGHADARDAEGLVGMRTVEPRPRPVGLTLPSKPPAAPVTYEARSVPAPLTHDAAIGSPRWSRRRRSSRPGRPASTAVGRGRARAQSRSRTATTLDAVYRGNRARPRRPDALPEILPDLLLGPSSRRSATPRPLRPGRDPRRGATAGRLRGIRRRPVRPCATCASPCAGGASVPHVSLVVDRAGSAHTAADRLRAPLWMRATLSPGDAVAWELALGGTPPRGRYDALLARRRRRRKRDD